MAEKQYFFDKAGNVKRLLQVFYGVCALLLLLDLFVHRHIEHSWERLIGFYPLYGFIGCVLLVVIAKWMRTFLMRPHDYYLKEERRRMAQRDAGQLSGSARQEDQHAD